MSQLKLGHGGHSSADFLHVVFLVPVLSVERVHMHKSNLIGMRVPRLESLPHHVETVRSVGQFAVVVSQ